MLGALLWGHMVAYINLFSSYWVLINKISIHGKTMAKGIFIYILSISFLFTNMISRYIY
jgi:hypothetical protein